jgi:hypothetical protein
MQIYAKLKQDVSPLLVWRSESKIILNKKFKFCPVIGASIRMSINYV